MQLTDLQRVRFPVLRISRRGLLEVSDDEDALTVCGTAALASGHFTDATIIDVAGHRFRIRGATKVVSVGPFFGFRLMLSRRIKVRYELEPQPNLEVATAKELVLKAMRQTHHFWNARADAAEVRALVRQATSFRELFELVRDG